MKDAKISKINDERLVGYINRGRNGSEQVFYTGSDSRDWDRYRKEGDLGEVHDKPDTIRLQPSERHFYAQLIDDEWWWVNGCGECNGRGPHQSYVKCSEHNVCETCSTPRSELKEPPWGTETGFICKPCWQIQHDAAKKEALEKFASEEFDEWDFEYTDDIVCPNCGLHTDPDDVYEDTEYDCERCDETFKVEVEHSISFSTSTMYSVEETK